MASACLFAVHTGAQRKIVSIDDGRPAWRAEGNLPCPIYSSGSAKDTIKFGNRKTRENVVDYLDNGLADEADLHIVNDQIWRFVRWRFVLRAVSI